MSSTNGIQYAVLNFDVHGAKALYNEIYREIGPHAIRNFGSQSSCLINFAHKARFDGAMEKINGKAKARGKQVSYRIRRLHPDEAGENRQDSILALKALCATISDRLLTRADEIEKKFNSKTDDVNEMLQKRNDAISQARRDLDEARSLTLVFLVEGEVGDAVKATQKIVEAETAFRNDLKETHKEELKKLREAKREAKKRMVAGKK